MISFEVNDMTCGHCVSTITKALRGVDATAKVQFDLARHRVDIEPGEAGASELRDAIQEAGYTPVSTESPPGGAAVSVAPARKGCCCG
jgi:copper chaperone